MTPGQNPLIDEAQSYTYGDEWPGLPLTTITIKTGSTEAPPSSNLARVMIQWRANEDDEDTEHRLDSALGEVTIVSAANWQLLAVKRLITQIPVGKHVFAVLCIAADGGPLTVIESNMEVWPQLVIPT